MRISTKKLLAFMIAIIMLVPIITVSLVASAAGQKTFTLDAVTDFDLMPTALKKSGEGEKCGTDGYFTLYYSAKTLITSTKDKLFSDGYSPTQRIDFKEEISVSDSSVVAAVGFRATSASTVKVWWGCGGDNRTIVLLNSKSDIVAKGSTDTVKNSIYYTEFQVEAGTYYYGNIGGGSNYLFKLEVVESDYSDTSAPVAWSDVEVPSVTFAKDLSDGYIGVKVDAKVGNIDNSIYADRITITVEGGDVFNTASFTTVGDGQSFYCSIAPGYSGKYKVYATIEREGEEPKVSEPVEVDFIRPLVAPFLSSATSKGAVDGKGTIELEYTEAPEAEKYIIYRNGTKVGDTTELKYTVTGLTIGRTYSFAVASVRGSEVVRSDTIQATPTEDAKPTWAFTYYGPSTGDGNGYSGNLNEDGKVTVYSEGGKGKIQPASTDGLAFYYTKIPTDLNFTLRATVTVDSWTFSNGQEGFGLMVADRLGVAGDKSELWNNQYMAGTTKIEYKYESDEDGNEYIYDTSYGAGTKYTMKLGLGMISKTGVNHDNLADISTGKTDVINRDFVSLVLPLETGAGGFAAGTYNAIDKCTSTDEAFLETNLPTLLSTFVLEIQRNNTGYFIRYYDLEGNLIREIKNYDPEALDQLDADFVYAGFYAARNARATFSDVVFTTIDPKLDDPAEARPITYVTPSITITSPNNTTSKDYRFAINTNVDGVIKIKDYLYGTLIAEAEIKAYTRLYLDIELTNGYNIYDFTVEFNPDDDQDLGEYTELINNQNVYEGHTVTYRAGSYHKKNIYISPTGNEYGTGSKEAPYDIATAISSAVPGQTLILMEGTYEFITGFTIQRGNNGTEENPIRLIADPEATTRPVLDFKNIGTGLTHGGDWWIFEGFDVTRSANGQKGFQVSGNHNVLIDIHAYRNGNTGIQISRYSGTDYTIDYWPSYNLVLNCDSYYNMDAGHEDADGFAAKLTVGPGNVFDGCVAHDNADDGWDLYAKVQTGAIGSVTIKNCVAYHNGYLEDGTASKGNGNGFKMGGESISGKHVLINSVAFDNRMKGIDSNSCPDIRVYNSISFNNGGSNVAFYTNREQTTDFVAQGIISISTNGSPDDNLAAKGTQLEDRSGYLNKYNFYWSNGVSANSEGIRLTAADIFVSLEFDYEAGVQRNTDGTINLGDFLKLKEGSVPEGVGTTGDSTPSPEIVLGPDAEHTYTDVWYNLDVNRHWQECECGDRINIGKHEYEWVIDKEPTATEFGYKHQECVICHYKRVRIAIEPTGGEDTPPVIGPGTGDNTPPVVDPGTGDNTPPSGDTEEAPSFFDMIMEFIQQILDWIKSLFGGSQNESENEE